METKQNSKIEIERLINRLKTLREQNTLYLFLEENQELVKKLKILLKINKKQVLKDKFRNHIKERYGNRVWM